MKTNTSAFDLFTIAHFAFGIWAGQFIKPVYVAAGMTFWELSENVLKENIPGLFVHPGKDSFSNSLVDVLSAYAGAQLTRMNMKREGIL